MHTCYVVGAISIHYYNYILTTVQNIFAIEIFRQSHAENAKHEEIILIIMLIIIFKTSTL